MPKATSSLYFRDKAPSFKASASSSSNLRNVLTPLRNISWLYFLRVFRMSVISSNMASSYDLVLVLIPIALIPSSVLRGGAFPDNTVDHISHKPLRTRHHAHESTQNHVYKDKKMTTMSRKTSLARIMTAYPNWLSDQVSKLSRHLFQKGLSSLQFS
jgi:hypothetical protein